MTKFRSFFVATLLIPLTLSASEVDQFQMRFIKMKNASVIANKQANTFLQEALDRANKKPGCREKRLYRILRKYFRNNLQGKLVHSLVKNENVEKRYIPVGESIYKDFSLFTAPAMKLFGWQVPGVIGMIVQMDEFQIGTDKFEHFFGRGYAYFHRYYNKGYTLEKLMEYGDGLEEKMLGAYTTAIKSFGDLSANFNGMRFWNNMLQKHDDILGAEFNYGPYIACVDNKWVTTNNKINFMDYIDVSWDEGNNCSDYKNQKALSLVNQELEKLSDKSGLNMQCPIQYDEMLELKDKYGEMIGGHILNFKSKSLYD